MNGAHPATSWAGGQGVCTWVYEADVTWGMAKKKPFRQVLEFLNFM